MTAPVTNSPLVKANIPHSTTDTLEKNDLGVIIVQQHQWDNPKNPLDLTSKTSKSPQNQPLSLLPSRISTLAANQEKEKNVATGRETARTPNKAQAQETKPKQQKQPENANQREIRLQRNRRTTRERRDKQRAEVEAKRQQIAELAMRNDALRQKIQNKLQELAGGPGASNDTSGIIEKMNLLVSSFTHAGTNVTRNNGRPLGTIPPLSDSHLPTTSSLPVKEEFKQALRELLVQHIRSKQTPQELPPQHAQIHGSHQTAQTQPRPDVDNAGRLWKHEKRCQHQYQLQHYQPQQQPAQRLQLIHDPHRNAQLQSLRRRGHGIWHDENALDERKKAPDYQGVPKGGTKEQHLSYHHQSQEPGEKRQRIRQDHEIALHQWHSPDHRQDQPLIDHRWQQLKEEEEQKGDDGGKGGGEEQEQGMREDEKSPSKDWQQGLSGDFSHEDHQRQQLDRQLQQMIKDQTQGQELRERERKTRAESDLAQPQEDKNFSYNMYKKQDKANDKCAIQTEQVQQYLEDHRQRMMYQNEMMSMSPHAQDSQQQNFHYPNHLNDRVDDQQHEPRANDQHFQPQRQNSQRYISKCDQMSHRQSQRIVRRYLEQQSQRIARCLVRHHLLGWQEAPTIGQKHGIDAVRTDKQTDIYYREEATPNQADLQMQSCGATQQKWKLQQWAKEGQDQYQDQIATEQGQEEQPYHVDMKGDLSLDQRNQLADFLQWQMEQIETGGVITQCLELSEKKDSMSN